MLIVKDREDNTTATTTRSKTMSSTMTISNEKTWKIKQNDDSAIYVKGTKAQAVEYVGLLNFCNKHIGVTSRIDCAVACVSAGVLVEQLHHDTDAIHCYRCD